MTTTSQGSSRLLVSRTANALTALSLAAAPGDFLGAEGDLLLSLGVSRPTLRQAAKIVESERMITVRRGSKGGFHAARPDAADVIRAPARYLRVEGATLADVHDVTRLITEAVAVAAAASQNSGLRQQLADFAAHIADNDTVADLIRSETQLARLLAEMSGNPAARLFIEIAYTFGRDDRQQRFYQTAADRENARQLQAALCKAVLAGDAEVARLMMQRRSALVSGWMTASDMEGLDRLRAAG
jgi:DNA-binding FadR family transcriptional regulator